MSRSEVATGCSKEVVKNSLEVVVQIVLVFSIVFLLVNSWFLSVAQQRFSDAEIRVQILETEVKLIKQFLVELQTTQDQRNPEIKEHPKRRRRSVAQLLLVNDLGNNTDKTEDLEEFDSEEELLTTTTPRGVRRQMRARNRGSDEHAAQPGITFPATVVTKTHKKQRKVFHPSQAHGKETRQKFHENLNRHDEVELLSAETQSSSKCTSCSVVAAHFVADTSNYTQGKHPHYEGNGRVRIPGMYKDWKPAAWSHKLDLDKLFHLHQGDVTIRNSGIYLIYAQVHYSSVQELNGYKVMRNREPLTQCTTTASHPNRKEIKADTCSVSTAVLLNQGDKVYLQDLHIDRYVILTPDKSYFGLIMLSSIDTDADR